MNCTSPVRAIALLIAVAAATTATTLLAATPTAVWDGSIPDQGFNTQQGGLSFTYSGDVTKTDERITIGNGVQDSGARLDVQSLSLSKATVLVKFSNFAKQSGHGNYPAVFMSARDTVFHEIGVRADDDATKFTYYCYEYTETTDAHGNYSEQHKQRWQNDGDTFCDAGGDVAIPSGFALFSYDKDNGVSMYFGASMGSLSGSSVSSFKFTTGSPTIKEISIGGSPHEYLNDAWSGLVIEKVAFFAGERLSPSDIADFQFPSVSASEVNAAFGAASEVNLSVADGTIVIGDTTFTATKVNFLCNGSLTILPPAGNTAAFDFSGVTGQPIVRYTGFLPTASGTTFTSNSVPEYVTNASDWTGIIWLRSVDNVTDFNVNSYGNASSVVRLSGINGWLSAPGNYTYTNSVPVELCNDGFAYALRLGNGNSASESYPLRSTAFVKIFGDGTFKDYTWSTPVIKVFDISEFTGTISLTYGTCMTVCDPTTVYDSLYALFNGHPASLRIESEKSVAVAAGKTWTVNEVASYGNLTVNGTLSAIVSETIQGSLVGSGRIVAPSGSLPGGIFTDVAWAGTLSISDVATPKNDALYPFNLQNFCSVNSTVELTSVGSSTNNTTYLPNATVAGRVVLVDAGDTPALRLSDGISTSCTTIGELVGSGTFTNLNTGIYQGLTINVMTNFTGTLAPENMIVTFGTETRHGRTGGSANNKDTMRRLYIDQDAVLSVPAGFALWNPTAVVIDGPVNFTTEDEITDGFVLLDNTGSSVSFGDHAAFSINGVTIDRDVYSVRRRNGQIIVKERRGFLGVVK